MHNLATEILGYIAAAFGTCMMLPQVYKSIKTKKVNDISLTMVLVYIISCSLWCVYGYLIGSIPIILGNTIASAISITQFVMTMKYKSK